MKSETSNFFIEKYIFRTAYHLIEKRILSNGIIRSLSAAKQTQKFFLVITKNNSHKKVITLMAFY